MCRGFYRKDKMKNYVLFLISGIFAMNVSCLNDSYEDILDTSDSDIISASDSSQDETAAADEDSNSQVTDNSQTQNDTDNGTQTDDTQGNDDNQTDNETTDDDTSKTECGNGVVETGEVCDKNTIDCTELDDSFTGGTATCQEGCRGWNVDTCEGGSTVTPLAEIAATSFTVEYLYNGVTDFNNGANINNELWSGPLFSASITLTNGSYTIPHPQTNAHWLAGFYDSQAIQFVQQSFLLDDYDNLTPSVPYIVMGAGLSDAVNGAELSIGIKNENEVNFIVQDMMNDADCIILVGYGTLKVDNINLTAGAAGEFSFTTSKIGLYLPAQTPEGDMTSEIESSGFTICQ